MQQRDMTHSDQRLVKIIRFGQLAIFLVAILHAIKAIAFSLFAYGISSLIMFIAACALTVMLRLIESDRKVLGVRGSLVVVFLMVFITIWLEGGLLSPLTLTVPILLMFAALYGKLIDTVCLCLAFLGATFFIHMNSIHAWVPFIADSVGAGYYRLFTNFIQMSFTAYLPWAVAYDIREALIRLKADNQSVEASKEAIVELSKSDSLTGLVNTKQAKINFDTLSETLPVGHSIYFYFIDLDGFKVINDLFDHKTGDDLLVSVANTLKATANDDANVCRLSGDEFAIFFTDSNSFDATEYAKELLEKISEPLDLYGTEIQVTASIGIAATHRNSFDKIRKKADIAMYHSKRTEKNSFQFYSEALEKEHMKRIYVIQGLQECLHNGSLELHYQPKIELPSQNITGVEALIRWQKNNPKQYTPDEFMDVIESTELVHEVGNWVIKEACIACQAWHLQGHKISVAVNVSAQQLLNPKFSEKVATILSSVGLDPQYLEIELTERYLVDCSFHVERQLMALRKIGVKLAIDDFGTGYSNVSYLTDLEVDVLKIDQAFIKQLESNESVNHIVQGITQIAQVMDMQVVAEGVETESEAQTVINLGCEVGQGYFWAKPMNFQNMVDYLTNDDQHFTSKSIA